MMKKSSILLLKKLNKSDKDRSSYDLANKNSELNQEISILEIHKENLKDELLFNSNSNEDFVMLNYSSNWHSVLIKQISTQQDKILCAIDNVELSKINMKEIIKISLVYNNLS